MYKNVDDSMDKMDSNKSSAAECEIFDFMANHLGLTVIHPGGLKATQKLEDTIEN